MFGLEIKKEERKQGNTSSLEQRYTYHKKKNTPKKSTNWIFAINSDTLGIASKYSPIKITSFLEMDTFLLTLLVFLMIITESLQGPHEKRLLNNLLATYNTLERPVANESEALEVKFGLTLQQIIDVDEKNQLLITNIWLSLEWNDYNLRWNESEYGGVKDLRITPNKLWKPDVLMYNSADEGFDGTYHTNIVVKHNGSCLYVPPGIFKSTCKIDITWFPFDDQHCDMKFGSWTYDGNQLDLVLNSEDGGDLSDFITNGEWYLLGVTILLSLTVFLNLVAETLPQVSDAIPLLGSSHILTLK
uniref:Putative acetylcholine receptor subunit alpha-type acr-16 pogonomyrmex barbatus n=1 Tax=Lutzomyia longipalpis TaxID=7200 RepID=A0A1B0C8Z3_LUTLO